MPSGHKASASPDEHATVTGGSRPEAVHP
uniref:Uncharacterized protein n=1 Tax=Arundo donax TaxID=35708 RepID=A0A0A9CDX1_ARUDO